MAKVEITLNEETVTVEAKATDWYFDEEENAVIAENYDLFWTDGTPFTAEQYRLISSEDSAAIYDALYEDAPDVKT